MRGEHGADGGAAEWDLAEARQRVRDARNTLTNLRGVACELLTESDRDCIHPVRAPGFHDVVELLRLALEALRKPVERRDEIVHDLVQGREVYCRWKDVVGALAHVDVVIRVHIVTG